MKKGFIRKSSPSHRKLSILAGLVMILSACGIDTLNLEAGIENDVSQNCKTARQAQIKRFDETQPVSYQGLSFQNKIPAYPSILAAEKPASPLEEPTDKADGVKPRSLVFSFEKGDPLQRKTSSVSPEIRIYRIGEYRRAFAVSDWCVKEFDKEIAALQNIINRKSTQIAYFPLLLSGEWKPSTISQIKHLTFKNGAGVAYLTQFNIEQDLISNYKISYVFQGLSADGKYYVEGAFPVSTNILPESSRDGDFKEYALPDFDFHNKKTMRESLKDYKKYLPFIERLLRKQKDDDFEPHLTKIDETLASLEVNWAE